MSLEIEIEEMGNAAFAEDARGETARILQEVTDLILAGEDSGTIRDVNGNAVGRWCLELPEDDEEQADDD